MGLVIEGSQPPKQQKSLLKRTDCCSLQMMLEAGTFTLNSRKPFDGMQEVCSSCRDWEDRTQKDSKLDHLVKT